MTTKNGKPVMHIAGHSDDIAKVLRYRLCGRVLLLTAFVFCVDALLWVLFRVPSEALFTICF